MSSFSVLFRLSFILEWRERNGLFNTLLYALATSYIASLVFEIGPGVKVWSGLIWFLMLFNSITASSASFRHEAGSRFMYYHQLVEPQQLFLAKWIYNILYGLILILIQYGLLQFFIGAPTEQGVAYLLQLVAGATGLMGVLTLTSAIASLSGNNVSLMAVLSFPLLIPVLLIGLRGTVKAGIDASWSELWPYIGANLGMSALVAALGYLLFPYLWRD